MSRFSNMQTKSVMYKLIALRAGKIDIFDTLSAIERIAFEAQEIKTKTTTQIPTLDYCMTVQSNELAAYNESLERFCNDFE